MVSGIGGVGGVGGVNLSLLAEQYRQQVLSGTTAGGGTADATATGGVGGLGIDGTGGVGGSGTVAAAALDPSASARGADFARTIGVGLSRVEELDRSAAGKAVQAATGDLRDVQDYVIAAMEAQTATELTTTVRNKALDAFNEIMRMPL